MAEYQASFHGIYAHPNPPLRALEESIGKHMKAYGFTDVSIKMQPAESLCTPEPEIDIMASLKAALKERAESNLALAERTAGSGSGPLPGGNVTVVQDGGKTKFITEACTPEPENRRVLAFELNDPGSFEIRTEARPDPRLAELLAAAREMLYEQLDSAPIAYRMERLRAAVAEIDNKRSRHGEPECPNCANPPHEGECRRKGAAVREQEDALLMRKRNANLLELLEAVREAAAFIPPVSWYVRGKEQQGKHIAERLLTALRPFDKILR